MRLFWLVFCFLIYFKIAGLLPTPVAEPLLELLLSLKTKLFGCCIGLLCWLCPAPLLWQGKPGFLSSLSGREGDVTVALSPVRGKLQKDCPSSGPWACLKLLMSSSCAVFYRGFQAASAVGAVLGCCAGGKAKVWACLGNNVLLLLLSSSSHDGHPHGHDR